MRHLRCFIAVAEELHFARAAEKLHIEQSPLSRTIKELEEDLGVRLFERTTRSTRLTHAGHIFLEHVPRVFAAIGQARDSVKAVAAGYHGQLSIALSDSISQGRLTALLALCREQEPDADIHLVMDNYGTHKTPPIKNWLARHPRLHVHFTPTSASWLNQVEGGFATLTQRCIRRGTHRSTRQLKQAIRQYLDLHNAKPKLFVWSKTAEDILASVERFCLRASNSRH